jgi:predicted MFS family arabinose efflux permease
VLIPLTLINLVGPSVDVTSRMIFLALEPAIRTRLTTIYIVIMFIGGGIGSVLGTAIYDGYGWAGTCLLVAIASATISLLAWANYRRIGAR